MSRIAQSVTSHGLTFARILYYMTVEQPWYWLTERHYRWESKRRHVTRGVNNTHLNNNKLIINKPNKHTNSTRCLHHTIIPVPIRTSDVLYWHVDNLSNEFANCCMRQQLKINSVSLIAHTPINTAPVCWILCLQLLSVRSLLLKLWSR